MRLATGGMLLRRASADALWQLPYPPAVSNLAEVLAALSVIFGLVTPCGSALIVVIELWRAYGLRADAADVHGLLATLGASLALLGPGAWSIDARLFGWRQIAIGRVHPGRTLEGSNPRTE